jgi:predicted RNase H-like HicB family nuclease
MYYQVPLKISKQEDGLWRVEATCLQGCWVDAPTLEQALAEIHEVIAMVLDLYQEDSYPLPEQVKVHETLPLYASIPICPDEIEFYKVLPTGERVPASAAARQRMARREPRFA